MYDRAYGDFPAKNIVYTPYHVYIWFWPTLHIGNAAALLLAVCNTPLKL